MNSIITKILKFGITGGLGTISNLVLFFIMVDLLHLPINPVNVFCFVFCVTQNYILNQIWTFKSKNKYNKLSIVTWFKFLLANLIGFIVNISVLNLLVYLFSWKYFVIPQSMGILCGMILNFIMSNYFVFRGKK